MVPALHDYERVSCQVLARHKPRGGRAILQAANAKAAALPKRIACKPLMCADHLTIRRFDRSRIGRQPGLQELAKRTLPDETDACGIALVEDRQAAVTGNRAYLRLAKSADRKVACGKFRAGKHMQEVALVLRRIHAAQQTGAAADAGVMPGRKAFCAEAPRI